MKPKNTPTMPTNKPPQIPSKKVVPSDDEWEQYEDFGLGPPVEQKPNPPKSTNRPITSNDTFEPFSLKPSDDSIDVKKKDNVQARPKPVTYFKAAPVLTPGQADLPSKPKAEVTDLPAKQPTKIEPKAEVTNLQVKQPTKAEAIKVPTKPPIKMKPNASLDQQNSGKISLEQNKVEKSKLSEPVSKQIPQKINPDQKTKVESKKIIQPEPRVEIIRKRNNMVYKPIKGGGPSIREKLSIMYGDISKTDGVEFSKPNSLARGNSSSQKMEKKNREVVQSIKKSNTKAKEIADYKPMKDERSETNFQVSTYSKEGPQGDSRKPLPPTKPNLAARTKPSDAVIAKEEVKPSPPVKVNLRDSGKPKGPQPSTELYRKQETSKVSWDEPAVYIDAPKPHIPSKKPVLTKLPPPKTPEKAKVEEREDWSDFYDEFPSENAKDNAVVPKMTKVSNGFLKKKNLESIKTEKEKDPTYFTKASKYLTEASATNKQVSNSGSLPVLKTTKGRTPAKSLRESPERQIEIGRLNEINRDIKSRLNELKELYDITPGDGLVLYRKPKRSLMSGKGKNRYFQDNEEFLTNSGDFSTSSHPNLFYSDKAYLREYLKKKSNKLFESTKVKKREGLSLFHKEPKSKEHLKSELLDEMRRRRENLKERKVKILEMINKKDQQAKSEENVYDQFWKSNGKAHEQTTKSPKKLQGGSVHKSKGSIGMGDSRGKGGSFDMAESLQESLEDEGF
jgi:hypothetical protein